ncbi:MAG: cyclic nucleotide-binding domain-containing protein, partial [Cyanobacteria bacterium P01_H01_bin.119]
SIAAIKIGFANGDFLGVQRLSNDRYRVERYQWDNTLGEQGAPNSDLANRQTQRRQQAAVFEAAQTWPEAERPTHITQTVVFNNTDNTWQVISETEDQGILYAPLQPDYKAAIASPNQSVWTQVYALENQLSIDSAIAYGGGDTPQAVISVTLSLQRISDYLAKLRKPEEGLLFILDAQDRLVASSDPDLAATLPGASSEADLVALPAIDQARLQTAHQALQANNVILQDLTGLQEFSRSNPATGQRYFIAVSPLERRSWVIGSVTPESFFMASINRNHRRLLVGIALLLGSGTLLLGYISDRVLIRPILSISDAAADIEAGQFNPDTLAPTAQRSDELGRLAQIMQHMALVIGDREQSMISQLEDLRDRGTSMTGSQLEIAYYQSIATRAAHLRAAPPSPSAKTQFPAGALKSYYQALRDRAESVRATHIGGGEISQMLRNEAYLAQLPDGDLRELASIAQRQAYGPGDALFQEGDPSQMVYALAQGRIDVRSTTQDGSLLILHAGQVFGDLTVMLDIPRTTSLRALDPVVVFAIDAAAFGRILRNNPQAIPAVERKLARYQIALADSQIWFSHAGSDLPGGATWLELATQQLHHWWHGNLVET